MLISVMYHNINSDKYSNDLELFKNHLIYIKNHFNIILPGDIVRPKSICLTFDDGFYNFYNYVFPLLKELNLKVILAIPTKYILEKTFLKSEQRLNISHDNRYSNIDKAPFCTFKELREMNSSGLVKIASHSHTHVDLTKSENLEYELKTSKNILENKLDIKIDSFVFPFGKYDDLVLEETKKYYKYLFRIGNGINKNFNGIKGVIYRINGDNLQNPKEIFSFKNMLKYRLKSSIKSLG